MSGTGGSTGGALDGVADGAIDALVVGRSLPALLAALELAEVGLRVAIAGGPVELPGTNERDPDGVLSAALAHVAAPLDGSHGDADASTGAGSGEDRAGSDRAAAAGDPALLPLQTRRPAPMLPDRAGAWTLQADPSVLGIPAVPLAVESLRLLGTAAALRAYLDRVTPLLTIGKTRSMGELVRRRLGRTALERLSEPVLRARFGVPSAEVEAAIAAPGLNEALSRAGSLTAAALAYSDRNVARETTVRPGGGWPGFVEALLRRLVAYGVDLIDAEVTEASRTESGGWTAALADGRALGSAALILDAGSTPARPGTDPGAGAETTSGAGLATPLPERTRLHAEIDIQEVPGLEELDAAGSAVRTVGRFSLVIHPADAEGSLLPRAELRGLAEAGGRPSAAVDPAAPLVDELSAALAEAGVDPAEDAGWRIRVAAAPFATTAERDRSRAALSERRAHLPELLVVGRALHGDDISAAVSDAQQEAIVLRRRLLGIAD